MCLKVRLLKADFTNISLRLFYNIRQKGRKGGWWWQGGAGRGYLSSPLNSPYINVFGFVQFNTSS